MSFQKSPPKPRDERRKRFVSESFEQLPLFPKLTIIGLLTLPFTYLSFLLKDLAQGAEISPWQNNLIKVLPTLSLCASTVLLVGGSVGHYASLLIRGIIQFNEKRAPLSQRAGKLIKSLEQISQSRAKQLNPLLPNLTKACLQSEILALHYAVVIGALMALEGNADKYFQYRSALDAAIKEKYLIQPKALQEGYFEYLDSINTFFSLDREAQQVEDTAIESQYKRCLGLLTKAFLDGVRLEQVNQNGLQAIVHLIDDAFSFSAIQAALFLDGKPLLGKMP